MLYTIFLKQCSGYIGNRKKMKIAPFAAVFVLVVIHGTLIGCANTFKSSGVITSREATDIWHSYEILPNYKYYYSGSDAQPKYIIGIDDTYKLKSVLWKPVDLTSEMLKDWINFFRPRVGGYNPLPYGAFITGPNGEQIGLWYSVLDWRLTGSAKLGENNEVTVFMPSNEGHLKKDQMLQNEHSVSNEKSEDLKFPWISSYSVHADQLR
jgi:hypothetical protein